MATMAAKKPRVDQQAAGKRFENLEARLSRLQIVGSRIASALSVIASPLEGDADAVPDASSSALRAISDAMYGYVQIIESLSRELDFAVDASDDKGV